MIAWQPDGFLHVHHKENNEPGKRTAAVLHRGVTTFPVYALGHLMETQ